MKVCISDGKTHSEEHAGTCRNAFRRVIIVMRAVRRYTYTKSVLLVTMLSQRMRDVPLVKIISEGRKKYLIGCNTE